MIEEIEKRLADGEIVELECVDRIGLLKDIDRSEANEEILDQGSLVVDYIDYDGDIRLVGHIDDFYLNVIASEEFKYFRIKRPAPIFNDLIDVAVKALKDGVLGKRIMTLSDYQIGVNIDSRDYSWSGKNVVEGIEFFKSLYTETFVIEDFQDTKKLKSGAKAILSNGEEVVFSNRTGVDDSLWFKYNGCYSAIIPYIALKGATVTQKR